MQTWSPQENRPTQQNHPEGSGLLLGHQVPGHPRNSELNRDASSTSSPGDGTTHHLLHGSWSAVGSEAAETKSPVCGFS